MIIRLIKEDFAKIAQRRADKRAAVRAKRGEQREYEKVKAEWVRNVERFPHAFPSFRTEVNLSEVLFNGEKIHPDDPNYARVEKTLDRSMESLDLAMESLRKSMQKLDDEMGKF